MELLICIGLFFLDIILLCKSFDVTLETLLFIKEWRETQELEGNNENDRGIEHRRGGNQQADDEGLEASSESMEDEERGRGDQLPSGEGCGEFAGEENRAARGRDFREKTQADQDFGF